MHKYLNKIYLNTLDGKKLVLLLRCRLFASHTSADVLYTGQVLNMFSSHTSADVLYVHRTSIEHVPTYIIVSYIT